MIKQKYIIGLWLILSMLGANLNLFAQEQSPEKIARITAIKQKLEKLSSTALGLNEKGNVSVSGVVIQEYLRGIAQSHNLNVNIDPNIKVKVYNRFTDEKVLNIILFLCEEYDLNIRFTGSIMSFYKVKEVIEDKTEEKKALAISYNAAKDFLTLDLTNSPLAEVLKVISHKTGKHAVPMNGAGDKEVNIFVENVSFEEGIKELAKINGLELEKTNDDFYEISVGQVVNNKASGNKNIRSGNVRDGGRNGGNTQGPQEGMTIGLNGTTKIDIDAIDVEIGELIKAVSKAMDKPYFLFSNPKGKTTTHVVGVTYDEFLNYVLQGSDFTYKMQDDDLYLIGERKHESLRKTKMIRLQHRPAEEIVDLIPKELKDGVDIQHFPDLNAIIVSGSSPGIAELREFINELDQVVPMVMIEVIIVELKRGKTVKTGISAGIGDSTTATGGTLLPGVDFTLSSSSINNILNVIDVGTPINLGRVTPNFYMSVSALETNENVNVTSTPKLATLNGHEAKLSIGRTSYYLVEQTNSSTGLTPILTTNQQWNNVKANLEINITPTIAGDEQVTLDINVKNSDFVGEAVDNRPPNTVNTSFESMIRVKNEEMIVLGGLEKKSKSESGSGTPILSRIPILKWVFSGRSRSTSKEKSLVFIKPTIIY